jgi:hypothetical protein
MALMLSLFWTPPQTVASTKNANLEPETALVRITVPDRMALDKLVASDFDLTEYVREKQNGTIDADAIVTQSELKNLKQKGYKVTTIETHREVEKILNQRKHKVQQLQRLTNQIDKVKILRAQHFTNESGTFLYIEAKTSAGDAKSVALTASWTDGNGKEQTATLTRKVDQGEYLYHYLLMEIKSLPKKITITSNQGGSAEAPVTEWIGDQPPDQGDSYVSDFIDHYMTPEEVTERIEQLATEFPDLAEIVSLPNKTNGYQRKAQAVIGDPESNPEATIVLTSKAWGHEGGNDISVNVQAPKEPNADLEIDVDGDRITVNLATNGSAEPSSTASEVIKAINEKAKDLVSATPFRDYEGKDIVQPQKETVLDNELSAPKEVPRGPFEMKAIRIGKHRDGSKVGVLAYAQEHAREWVTPLVAVETAERLLRNYATDPDTKKLVDNLDIFIVPTMNPDGGNYSFYDYNWQRKNMKNYCGPENSDPYNRNSWGVDLNRNNSVGSVYDGYIGGSKNCLSGTYAGPKELSEPEERNITWLADENPNIKFAMNIHSYGGYFMWPPGAYDEDRNTLPRPTAGEEAYFWQASKTILEKIKEYRGTVVLPGRTGPVPDVLYSAAGNSADELWYNHGIFAWDFEVGTDLWNAEKKRWEPVGFQPPFEEGHAEGMEFANGLIGMLDVAYQYEKDKKPPHSTISPEKGTYDGPVEVSFEMNEPATIYYTLDGSRPTFESQKLQLAGTREGAETLKISHKTTIKWFAVDAAGNVENNYKPDGNGKNYNEATFEIKYGLPDGISAAGIKALVERFKDEGAFENESAAHALTVHLTAVDHFEKKREAEKVVKHTQGFEQLLAHQKEHGSISEKAFNILNTYADYLIEKWE